MENLFDAEELVRNIKEGNPYQEFLRVPSMSGGIYHLKKNENDNQNPHTEDEIYYIIDGKAMMFVGENNFKVKSGSIVFVGKNIKHKFHSIEEDLTVLVIFSRAEYTNNQ